MITFRDFSYRYHGSGAATLEGVELTVAAGDFALVVGSTGSGKSTLLRAAHGADTDGAWGSASGAVTIDGAGPGSRTTQDLVEVVGVVGQDPRAWFTAATVQEEIAHRLRRQRTDSAIARRRVEETLDLLGVVQLRGRALDTLSGGERQRVALASVLASGPRVLVLDEPTSALDPAAAEDVLAALLRLVHDVGITVLAAEHRLERVLEYADQLVVVQAGRCRSGQPVDMVADSPVVPPVVELGRLCGWAPPPLSVRDARRHAAALRTRLAGCEPPVPGAEAGDPADGLDVRSLVVRHGSVTALRAVDLQAAPGEVVALMGRNGSGKSSLLGAVVGSARPYRGSVSIAGRRPASLARPDAAHLVTLVPQQVDVVLRHDTVQACFAGGDRRAGAPAGTTRDMFDRLSPGAVGAPGATGTSAAGSAEQADPRRLSEGQRLCLAIAVQLAPRPRVVLLDEPTRGLDYDTKARLGELLGQLTRAGTAVVVATHDVEFVARTAQRVVVLADGEVVATGTTRHVLAASPVFAPQVAKVLSPLDWLTTDEVAHALEGEPLPSGEP